MESHNKLNNLASFPSPFTEKLVVVLPGDCLTHISIYHSSGFEVYSSNTNQKQVVVNSCSFLVGLYFIKAFDGSGNVYVVIAVKVR